jgi:hypothetical protein
MDKTILDQASVAWHAGHLTGAGCLIFESLPAEERPRWAIRLFKFAAARAAVPSPPVENLLVIADDPTRWSEAHDAFRRLRRAGIQLKELGPPTAQQQLLRHLLGVAEVTAKVIYNASGSPRPFDYDAGYWLGQVLKHFLDFHNGHDSSEQAWLILCGQEESP